MQRKISCNQLRIKLSEIKSLKNEFDLEIENIQETKDIESLEFMQFRFEKMMHVFYLAGLKKGFIFASVFPKSFDYKKEIVKDSQVHETRTFTKKGILRKIALEMPKM